MEEQHPTRVSWLNVLKWNGSGTGVFVVSKSDTISFSRKKNEILADVRSDQKKYRDCGCRIHSGEGGVVTEADQRVSQDRLGGS